MPTRVFKTAEFARFAAKARITDALLVEAIERVERGLVDADLGAGILKLRIARPNEGRQDGFRTIVACIIGERAFFLLGYGKNDRANIAYDDLRIYRNYGAFLQGLDDIELDSALRTPFITVLCASPLRLCAFARTWDGPCGRTDVSYETTS